MKEYLSLMVQITKSLDIDWSITSNDRHHDSATVPKCTVQLIPHFQYMGGNNNFWWDTRELSEAVAPPDASHRESVTLLYRLSIRAHQEPRCIVAFQLVMVQVIPSPDTTDCLPATMDTIEEGLNITIDYDSRVIG